MDYERRYYEAVERETWLRDFASITFGGKPLPVTLCGFGVEQLTLAHWGRLRVAKSPWVCVQEFPPTPDQIAQVVWNVSVGYPSNIFARRAVERFGRSLKTPRPPMLFPTKRRVDAWLSKCAGIQARYQSACEEIKAYFDGAFMDFPRGGVIRGLPKSFYAFTVGVVDSIASAYGWDREYIKSVPLAELSQYSKICRARDLAKSGKGPVMSNPSDSILAEEARAEYEEVLKREKESRDGRN